MYSFIIMYYNIVMDKNNESHGNIVYTALYALD